MNEETVVKTKGEIIRDYVNKRLEIGKDFWQPYQDIWQDIHDEYIGRLIEGKESWQGNFIIPTVKKIVRALASMYIEMLLSKGAESFDIAPGEESDKQNAENLRLKVIYDLRTLEIERKMLPIVLNFVLYGYAVAYVPWKHTVEKMRTGKDKLKDIVTYDGPDLECADIFNLYSDPNSKDMSSWKIYIKADVPIHYIKSKSKGKDKIFFNLDELQEKLGEGVENVDLVEYHGLVPKKLIEGAIDDASDPNPFDDDYVQAIIVMANDVVIRASAYPYWCNNIFVAFVNDHAIDEIAGMGVGEDIKTLAPMLTNLYNKLTDCVNIVTNPAYELVVSRYLGRGQTLLTRPGRIFPVKELNSIREIDTTAQASAIQLIPQLIQMINGVIEEVTGATPQITTGNKKDIHSTAAGLAMMTEKSMQPINSKVKFYLEPAFRKVLEIIYRHNIQHFKRADAVRILGEKKAKEFNLTELTRADIMLKGNPDFIPTGISGFMERQIEIKNLLDFMKISAGAMKPVMQRDLMGNETPATNPQTGEPIMKPVVALEEIIKQIAELFRFKDKDKLIPEDEPAMKQLPPPKTEASGNSATGNSRPGMAGRPTPVTQPGGNFLSRVGGQVPQ